MNPRSTIRELERKLGQLDQQREFLLYQIDCLDEQRDSLTDVIALFKADLNEEATQSSAERKVSVAASQPKEARNLMVEILRSLGQPVYYKDFVDLLRERSVTVNGVDPARTISAHLSNDERFVKVGRGMWALKSWPDSMKRVPEPETPDMDAALDRYASRANPAVSEPQPEPVPLFGPDRSVSHQRAHNEFDASSEDSVKSM